jgi:hypothetical protein
MTVAVKPAINAVAKTGQLAQRASDMNFASQFMAYLEENPIAEILFKDVTGYNLPRLATVRSPNEFWDTLTGEMGNTSISLGGTLMLPPLFQKVMSRFTRIPLEQIKKQVTDPKMLALATKTARLGSSLGYLTLWASLFWATPFFRNWLTLTRSKNGNFESMIGLEKNSPSSSPEKLKEAKRFQLNGLFQVLTVGAALSAASVLGGAQLARRLATKPLQAKNTSSKMVNTLEWLFKQFDLKGKKTDQPGTPISTLIFWSLPAYFGWLQASRSPNEFKENLLKTVNSNLWFFCMTPLVKKFFLKQYQSIDPSLTKVPDFKEILQVVDAPVRQKLLKLKQKDFGIGMAITVTMLATTPQIINRILTKRRFEKAQQMAKNAPATPKLNSSKSAETSRYNEQQSLILSKNTLPFEFFLLNNR